MARGQHSAAFTAITRVQIRSGTANIINNLAEIRQFRAKPSEASVKQDLTLFRRNWWFLDRVRPMLCFANTLTDHSHPGSQLHFGAILDAFTIPNHAQRAKEKGGPRSFPRSCVSFLWRKTTQSRLTVRGYSFAKLSTRPLWMNTDDGSELYSNKNQSKDSAHCS
jgi:hypothetical protein